MMSAQSLARRYGLPVLLATIGSFAMLIAGIGTGTVPARAAGSAGHWSTAQPIAGLPAVSAGISAVNSISCTSPGNCTVGGGYIRPSNFTSAAFLVRERDGAWGKPDEILSPKPRSDLSGAWINSVSCGAPGNCSAVGEYVDANYLSHALVISEQNGRWGALIPVRGASLAGGGAASITAVSCRSAGTCSAAGIYSETAAGKYWVFVVDERSGQWGKAELIAGPAGAGAQVSALSCGSPGNCVVGGDVVPNGDGHNQAFVASERDGRWSPARSVPGLAALNQGHFAGIASVACPSASQCVVAGTYQGLPADHPFVVTEANGRWGTAAEIPGTAKLASASATVLSCPSAGNCVAGLADGVGQSFLVSQRNGHWDKPIAIPGIARLAGGRASSPVISELSCPSAGNCGAAGVFSVAPGDESGAFVAAELHGSWGTAIEVPGLANLNRGKRAAIDAISCPAAGQCIAGGYYAPIADGQPADDGSTFLTIRS